MRWLCQGVTASLCLLAASGCYRAHDGDVGCAQPIGHVCCDASGAARAAPGGCPFECPPGTRLIRSGACFAGSADAAPPPDTGPFYDAGPRVDAGPAISCPEVRADFACLHAPIARAGEPFELSARFDTCGCCPDVACAVRAEPETGRVFLTTGLCAEPGDCFCDGCTTPRVDCPVPALEAGTWDVVVNGGEAFELEVLDEREPPIAACFSFAEPDDCLETPFIEPQPYEPDEVCFERLRGNDYRLRVTRNCGSCGELLGPCVTGVETTGEDEHAIVVSPFLTVAACDVDCTDECTRAVQYCELPPLPAFRDTYRVLLHGETEVLRFRHGVDTPLCDEPTPPG